MSTKFGKILQHKMYWKSFQLFWSCYFRIYTNLSKLVVTFANYSGHRVEHIHHGMRFIVAAKVCV